MRNIERQNAFGWPPVAIDFLVLFARAEGLLKQSGFLKNTKRAEADWNGFANTLGDMFFQQVKVSRKADTLLGEPPRRRLRLEFKWHPEEPPPLTTVGELFSGGVCQVRNNLAHGEKFTVTNDGLDRDLVLVTESLWVLRQALKTWQLLDGMEKQPLQGATSA